jgi:hypothetical protein
MFMLSMEMVIMEERKNVWKQYYVYTQGFAVLNNITGRSGRWNYRHILDLREAENRRS